MRAVAFFEALVAQVAQVGFGGKLGRDGEFGQVIALETEVHVAAFGDFEGVTQRFGDFGKQAAHLLRGAQVEGFAVVAHPVGVAE